jgi:hypothetical protein
MDKEWTKLGRETDEYQSGLDFFLDYAYTKENPTGKRFPVLVMVVTIDNGLQGM